MLFLVCFTVHQSSSEKGSTLKGDPFSEGRQQRFNRIASPPPPHKHPRPKWHQNSVSNMYLRLVLRQPRYVGQFGSFFRCYYYYYYYYYFRRIIKQEKESLNQTPAEVRNITNNYLRYREVSMNIDCFCFTLKIQKYSCFFLNVSQLAFFINL